MVQYLVIDDRDGIPYKDRYQIFTDDALAYKHFWNIGWKHAMWHQVDITPGMLNMIQCKDVNAKMIAIEINEQKYEQGNN